MPLLNVVHHLHILFDVIGLGDLLGQANQVISLLLNKDSKL